MEEIARFGQRVIENVERVIIGKPEEVELALVALLCQGHVLIEDVPGVGKTMLAKAVARSLGCSFKRLQFTPDMLPSDVTGVSVFNQQSREFEFRPGPIFAQIVLADEINRATPKTQSALLEAMEERQATVDGVTYAMPRPFLVLATQNPIEYEGTFNLPEAQLDRFLLRLSLGYPSSRQEVSILDAQRRVHPLQTLEQVAEADELLAMQEEVKEVTIEISLKDYMVELVQATREHPEVYLGASPRGSLALYRMAQARAALRARDYVLPEDVQALAPAALSHRIILSPSARMKDLTQEQVVQEVLRWVPLPDTAAWERDRSRRGEG